jgi:hypothetical protein
MKPYIWRKKDSKRERERMKTDTTTTRCDIITGWSNRIQDNKLK